MSTDEKDATDREEIEGIVNTKIQEIFYGNSTFEKYMKVGLSVIKDGIKASNSLPCNDNFKYFTCFPSFNSARSYQTKRILKVIQSIIESTATADDISRRGTEEKFELLVEANDIFLDRANALMNEESGAKCNSEIELVMSQSKKLLDVNGSWNTVVNRQLPASGNIASAQSVRLLGAKNVQRPQLIFKDKIDNTSKPWQPRIKEKPNALKSLSIHLEEGKDVDVFCHPYEYELNMFQVSNKQLEKHLPIEYKPLEETPLIMIEKEADIGILLNDLFSCDEIAIDLEHHSYRSFQGITCLMQISTRDTDYLIDTLLLRSELHKLNEIFTKPTILKVFHGADCDIQWLQRDLSLYVVNMFDTHQAAKQLELPYLSLAYLLKTYCGLEPNKHFQLADWRIRPLPQELMKYAREDTHYLLYIKDILRNALIDVANCQQNVLKAVYNRSTEICKKTYVKSIWTEESYMSMYRKSQKMFNNRQLFALKHLHKWRDTTAREEDDSVSYVLPNHMLLNIAETLPREMQGILACCNPIPPLVRQNLLGLHKIILKAREQPLIKPVLEEDIRQRMTQRSHVTHSETWIYSPHDTSQGTEPRADLPCLLNSNSVMKTLNYKQRMKHIITVFDNPSSDDDMEINNQILSTSKRLPFVSPFERYKRVMPMIAEHEAEERERWAKEKKKEYKLTNSEKTESINRVYEHFIFQVENKIAVEANINISLSQMHSKKRKIVCIDRNNPNETSIYQPSLSPETLNSKIVIENVNITKKEDMCNTFMNQTNCHPRRRKNAEDELVQPLRKIDFQFVRLVQIFSRGQIISNLNKNNRVPLIFEKMF
ncbi:exosome component 10 isoform X2 [Belonocnema kinseyi]|uniref:exosome component 10 isoform X2 n=1 Tax=Belonocnema kinseyi TaxID=2817044 RepID=UPI00143DF722|nr:exosome component 10 isoform X2 [Belonocnema kinseyi]